MNKTYKIQLPRNKEAQNIRTNIKDGTIEVEVELKEKWEPRDGDICLACTNDNSWQFIVIYGDVRRPSVLKAVKLGGKWEYSTHSTWKYDLIRPAIEYEKQLLFDALANEGKMWDSEKKVVVDLPRWRAENGEEYFDVIISPNNIRIYKFCKNADCYSFIRNYNIKDNRFKTKEAAERVAEQIREIFKNSKAE